MKRLGRFVSAGLALVTLWSCGGPAVVTTRRGEVSLSIVGEAALPQLELSHDVGSLKAGASTSAQVEATNTGRDGLVMRAPRYEGSATGAWFVRGAAGVLLPGQTARFTITFSPVGAGADTARLVFEHDASAPAAVLTLTGTATP